MFRIGMEVHEIGVRQVHHDLPVNVGPIVRIVRLPRVGEFGDGLLKVTEIVEDRWSDPDRGWRCHMFPILMVLPHAYCSVARADRLLSAATSQFAWRGATIVWFAQVGTTPYQPTLVPKLRGGFPMRKLILLASAAMLVAGPAGLAAAKGGPGGGHGGGGGHEGGGPGGGHGGGHGGGGGGHG